MTSTKVRKEPVEFAGGLPFYRDMVTMDPGFVFLFDFKSSFCTRGREFGANLAAGQTFKNLVDDGDDAVVTSAFASGLGVRGLIQSAGSGLLQLPDAGKLATDETHFAFCVWAGYDTGFGALGATQNIALGGYGNGLGADNQYAIYAATSAGSAVSAIRGATDGTVISDVIAGDLTAFTDGDVHQFCTEFEVLAGGTNVRRTIYVDGLQAGQATAAFSGSLNQGRTSPLDVPLLGAVPSFQANGFKGYYGRTWLKRFAPDTTNTPVLETVAKEWSAYSGRFA